MTTLQPLHDNTGASSTHEVAGWSGRTHGAEIKTFSGILQKTIIRTSDIIKARLRIIVKFRDVSVVKLEAGLREARHVVVMTVHNEAHRMPFLLNYYRAMGFEHFIVIDNKSDDHLQSRLAGEKDVSVFFSKGNFKTARFGMDWINGLLSKYCAKKWILHVDADEILVFPHCDIKSISALTDCMTKNRQASLQCLMIDMYSDKKIKDNICREGEDPLSICPYFDKDGYFKIYDPLTETIWIKGGVRGRIYFSNEIWKGPALNKTPLIFWQKHFAFLKCAHQTWPSHLNGGATTRPKVTGALLHFKFLSDLPGKVFDESIRMQHTEEYDAYASDEDLANRGPDFISASSVKYTGWRTLEQAGLIGGSPLLSEQGERPGMPESPSAIPDKINADSRT